LTPRPVTRNQAYANLKVDESIDIRDARIRSGSGLPQDYIS